jgi:ribonuclease HII
LFLNILYTNCEHCLLVYNEYMNLIKEKTYYCKGYKRVAGMDEAGRGAWAGPLVVGCVVVSQKINLNRLPYRELHLVNDSKQLSPKNRHYLFSIITKLCDWSVGIVSNQEIDTLGLQPANRLAFVRAWQKLSRPADFAIIDYLQNLDISVPHIGFPKADSLYFSVAAASIVAKEYRDQIMKKLDQSLPKYFFGQHKGYGTNLHQVVLRRHGVSKYHRISFAPVREILENS